MLLKKIFKIFISLFTVFAVVIALFAFANSEFMPLPKDVVRITNSQDFYNAVKKSICNYDTKLTVTIPNYDKDIYNLDIFKKVLDDNPQLSGLCNSATATLKLSLPLKMEITFKYSEDPKVLKDKEKVVQTKVDEIVKKVIKPEMKDYEKEAALHDYIVNNARYDTRFSTNNMPKESNTAYGILVNGVGACLGYSDAMDKLLKASGIESRIIIGDGNNGSGWIGHAWNVVKIGGQYYHLDSTWDDPVTEDGSNTPRYTYFNLSDKQIEKNHRWNKNSYPQCNSTICNSLNLNLSEKDKNGNVFHIVKSYDEFYSAIKTSLLEKKTAVNLKILNFNNNTYNVENTVNKIYNSIGKSGSYNWIDYSDEIGSSKLITLTFE